MRLMFFVYAHAHTFMAVAVSRARVKQFAQATLVMTSALTTDTCWVFGRHFRGRPRMARAHETSQHTKPAKRAISRPPRPSRTHRIPAIILRISLPKTFANAGLSSRFRCS